MIRRAMRVFCAVAGHDWGPPFPIHGDPLYQADCRRCDVVIKGDWEHLEENKVWKHWRSRDVGFWAMLKAILRAWWYRNIMADDELSARLDKIDRELEEKGQ